MAEPFLCQGLWQIRDLKLSKVIYRVKKPLWVSEEGCGRKNRKFLDVVIKGCNKQRTVLCRLTVLLQGCQRSGSTPGWTGKAQAPGSTATGWAPSAVKKYEWLVSHLLGLLGILPPLINFFCCCCFVCLWLNGFLLFCTHLVFIIYFYIHM